ncbi:hypothetical protein BDV96DRAFT_230749 [Lophiotrema nucula]|uniref:Uncharacterized protein n=1 Tax=Lophiotrema nucula TaxID=690887 RepID=A0A6A5YS88_9PLEO|nr:hypothetical protein BDV96DRAFT_230749 [Lophiotrema nucula]
MEGREGRSQRQACRRCIRSSKVGRERNQRSKAAKKAAEKALNFAEQAAKRARDQAEAKAMEERRRFDADYALRIQDYEAKLAIFAEALTRPVEPVSYSSPSMPLRTTSISQGDRRIEISEFARDRLELIVGTDLLPSGYEPEFVSEGRQALFRQSRLEPNASRRRTLSASTSVLKLLASPVEPNLSASQSLQKFVLLSSRLDRGSTSVTALQASLDECGVATVFSDSSIDHNALARQGQIGEGKVVRSTIFWEPPWLSLGSEVLSTMRLTGWRPFYLRRASPSAVERITSQSHHAG